MSQNTHYSQPKKNEAALKKHSEISCESESGRRLINEFVLGEESDSIADGLYSNHFEIYLSPMVQCRAGVKVVDHFLRLLRWGASTRKALRLASVPKPAQSFVRSTWRIIETRKPPRHLHSVAKKLFPICLDHSREECRPAFLTEQVFSVTIWNVTLRSTVIIIRRWRSRCDVSYADRTCASRKKPRMPRVFLSRPA